MKKKLLSIVLNLLLIFSTIVGCQVMDLIDEIMPSDNPIPNVLGTEETKVMEEESGILPVSTTIPQVSNHLSIWVLPQFDPNAETDAGEILNSRISAFQEQNPEIKLDVRIKAEIGASSLIDSLIATSLAAPSSLPSAILISRSDFETVISQGILQSIEKFSAAIDEEDWYPFARDMGIFHGEVFGLPFAADAVGMAVHDEDLLGEFIPLDETSSRLGPIGFAAGDPDSPAPFIFYQSAGGLVEDTQSQPIIEPEALINMLTILEINRKTGIFPSSLADIQSDEILWEAFLKKDLDGLVTWLNTILNKQEKFPIAPVPVLGDAPYTYARGWVWCLPGNETTNSELAADFVKHMVDPQFLSDWASESDTLPVRPSSITGWDKSMQPALEAILLSADLMPSDGTLSFAKSDIINAVQNILKGTSTPESSTQAIIEQLEESQAQ